MLPHLLLFDIDGTLLDTGGAGMRALVRALEELYPEQIARIGGPPPLDLAGSTDSGIVMELFLQLGVPDSGSERERFYASYLAHLHENLREPGGSGRTLGGVVELLDALAGPAGRGEVRIGLLTGNIAAGARAKLEHYGLHAPFGFGAFGDDHHDRDRLGAIAVARASEQHGTDLSAAPVTVIGDTPKDIRCARAFGARVLAVATGSIAASQLADHGPDQLFEDLEDTARVLGALGVR